jgi:hypothetical protein
MNYSNFLSRWNMKKNYCQFKKQILTFKMQHNAGTYLIDNIITYIIIIYILNFDYQIKLEYWYSVQLNIRCFII